MDSLLLSERIIASKDTLLALVCDGVGGTKDGAFSASFAVNAMNSWFRDLSDIDCIGLRMRDEALRINNLIIKEAKEKSLDTAATFTAILFTCARYYVVHIGDTRAYSFSSSNVVEQLTVDNVSASGALTGCIGRFENPVFFYSEGDACAKMFLICSDGLYKKLDLSTVFPEIRIKHRKDVTRAIQQLAERAIKHGEKDNISVALIVSQTEV
ncbi:MAG: protein phosphatase 2C domain-containing protein [Clostridiales bacterium]|nr:protein phosphatase 2C domain-containing protein [Clostridiales bacterium]